MSWLERQQFKNFVSSAGWLPPVGGLIAGFFVFRISWAVDQSTQWSLLGMTTEGARTLLGALISAVLTFIVFAFSILLIAIQLVSTSLSPRIIAIVYRSWQSRYALSLFMFTFIYAAGALGRIGDTVPQLCVLIAMLSSLLSIAVFVMLVDHFGKSLRPVSLLSRIGAEGVDVITDIYPNLLGTSDAPLAPPVVTELGTPDRIIEREGSSGIIIAFCSDRLESIAERADCTIELLPQVGDFVAKGDPLFHVYGGNVSVDADELANAIAFGAERTFAQDPLFALRIIVDVASKALSPAINDPTTAVLAIDQLHRLLRAVGRRRLDTGVLRDTSGRVRFVYRTPDWEDFVRLAVTEIRHFGSTSIQVVRRLRAMLDSLAGSMPPERARLLADELLHLKVSIAREFPEAWDREMSSVADSQGMGSPVAQSVSHAERVRDDLGRTFPQHASTTVRPPREGAHS